MNAVKTKEQILKDINTVMEEYNSTKDIDTLKKGLLDVTYDIEHSFPRLHKAYRMMLDVLRIDCRNPNIDSTILINPTSLLIILSHEH